MILGLDFLLPSDKIVLVIGWLGCRSLRYSGGFYYGKLYAEVSDLIFIFCQIGSFLSLASLDIPPHHGLLHHLPNHPRIWILLLPIFNCRIQVLRSDHN